MPLYADKRVVGNNIKSSSELLKKFPDLEKRSTQFSLQAQRTFQQKNILYVGQREYGTVYRNDTFVDVLGSDSATTCQIVALQHKGTGACSLAHFDGSGIPKALAEMVKILQEQAQSHREHRIEMYIVGGFLDRRNISEDVFMKILGAANNLSAQIDLICACVCGINDTLVRGEHVPRIYGIEAKIKIFSKTSCVILENKKYKIKLGVIVANGEIVPVQQFRCQIPDEILRHVALYNEQTDVLQVYSSRTQEVTVKPFNVHCSSERARKYASFSDERILQSFSTSPHCEPANFAEKLRKVFALMAENQNIMQKFFPRGKPRRFRPVNNGDWCLVEDNS